MRHACFYASLSQKPLHPPGRGRRACFCAPCIGWSCVPRQAGHHRIDWGNFGRIDRGISGTKSFAKHAARLRMEASPGIEPGCKDLQSSASPLRHEASLLPAFHSVPIGCGENAVKLPPPHSLPFPQASNMCGQRSARSRATPARWPAAWPSPSTRHRSGIHGSPARRCSRCEYGAVSPSRARGQPESSRAKSDE
jgi:hypothetical protein